MTSSVAADGQVYMVTQNYPIELDLMLSRYKFNHLNAYFANRYQKYSDGTTSLVRKCLASSRPRISELPNDIVLHIVEFVQQDKKSHMAALALVRHKQPHISVNNTPISEEKELQTFNFRR